MSIDENKFVFLTVGLTSFYLFSADRTVSEMDDPETRRKLSDPFCYPFSTYTPHASILTIYLISYCWPSLV